MENTPGWFNPTLLGVLLVVIVSVIYAVREAGKAVGTYLSDMSDRAAAIDQFLKDRLESSDERHKAQLAAWQSSVVKSTEASLTLAAAFESLEARSQERHEVVLAAHGAHAEEAKERHEEILATLRRAEKNGTN